MPEWLVGLLIGGTGGGILGYWFRAKVDDHFAARAEGRQFRREDLKELRDALLVFLGELRAHSSWLANTLNPHTAGGELSPDERARLIGDWVNKYAPRFPKDCRGPLYLIFNVAYQLARGDRHFLDLNSNGYELLEEAWETLDDYARELTDKLR